MLAIEEVEQRKGSRSTLAGDAPPVCLTGESSSLLVSFTGCGSASVAVNCAQNLCSCSQHMSWVCWTKASDDQFKGLLKKLFFFKFIPLLLSRRVANLFIFKEADLLGPFCALLSEI